MAVDVVDWTHRDVAEIVQCRGRRGGLRVAHHGARNTCDGRGSCLEAAWRGMRRYAHIAPLLLPHIGRHGDRYRQRGSDALWGWSSTKEGARYGGRLCSIDSVDAAINRVKAVHSSAHDDTAVAAASGACSHRTADPTHLRRQEVSAEEGSSAYAGDWKEEGAAAPVCAPSVARGARTLSGRLVRRIRRLPG